jgi:hypothetical protein
MRVYDVRVSPKHGVTAVQETSWTREASGYLSIFSVMAVICVWMSFVPGRTRAGLCQDFMVLRLRY